MILNCNACGKKFVVPDTAITATGRVVQCGACGNKWKQFPVTRVKQTQSISDNPKIASKSRNIEQSVKKIQKTKKIKKSSVKKPREINLYSPEYLAKKHGIKLSENIKATSISKKVSFGFYNSLLLFLLVIIFLSRGLYFIQDIVIQKFPFTEFYLNYFFESIKNMFEIWKNLISSY